MNVFLLWHAQERSGVVAADVEEHCARVLAEADGALRTTRDGMRKLISRPAPHGKDT